MPITFLNTEQAQELADALDHAVELCKQRKMDASVISLGTDTWVATPTDPAEYFDETLVRVCVNEADYSDNKHPWGTAYKSSETGEIKFMKKNK